MAEAGIVTMISDSTDYRQRYGFSVNAGGIAETEPGLNEAVIRKISAMKNEPEWMLDFRLQGLRHYRNAGTPTWAPKLSGIDIDSMTLYRKSAEQASDWKDVPEPIRQTFNRLGVQKAEKDFLGGVGAQFESESVYHHIKEELASKGVIFTDLDTALQKHPDIVRKHFATLVKADDNKYASLNAAAWSGGSFVYVPKGVKLSMPLQAYFRINKKNMGQFERTLIIAEEGAEVHYIEGCTAVLQGSTSLHAAVVEIIAMPNSKVRYTTIQNWSTDVCNLVTKRAICHENARMEWIDGNIGSKVTMKYPCVILAGKNAKADILSISFAGAGQHQDSGAKAIHQAEGTTSKIVSKSVCKDGGRTSFRSFVHIKPGCEGIISSVKCDSLMLDSKSRTDSYPVVKTGGDKAVVSHEAMVGRIDEDELFYMMQRGMTEDESRSLAVLGFFAPLTSALPQDYSIELTRLVELEMEGSAC